MKISTVRKRMGLTQMDLAVCAGVSLSTVVRCEREDALPAQRRVREALERVLRRGSSKGWPGPGKKP
jgi:DNA-binding XRE family transcriptional regulator